MLSTFKGLFTCIFDVVRVKCLFTLVLFSVFIFGPFLLTLTDVSVDRVYYYEHAYTVWGFITVLTWLTASSSGIVSISIEMVGGALLSINDQY